MKTLLKVGVCLFFFYLIFSFQPAFSGDKNNTGLIKPEVSADDILSSLEKKYSGPGFSADFFQESPLQEIDIIETAEGRAFFKKPEKFRWEYKAPDVLHYISDGENLWIHSPEDNNLWVGKTSTFFGKESSASFLTDIQSIKKNFNVKISDSPNPNEWMLILLPSDTTKLGIKKIFLSIDKKTNCISKIISFNINNEETRIRLNNYNFKDIPQDALFNFEILKTMNVIPLEQ